jgi:hypothetical protein
VTKVEITGADAKTTPLVRKGKDAWTVEPGGYAADPTEVRSYLSSLRATRAADFPDDAPADLGAYGLAAPRLVVAVTSKKNDAETTRKLLLGGETTQGSQKTEGGQKQIYAKRDDQPSVYAIGDWSYRSLGKTPAQFRDKTVLGFDPGRVGKFVIARKTGDGVTAARAEGGGWSLESADAKKPKNDAVTRYLDDLRDLRGADIAAEPAGALPRFGLDAPDLRIALTDKEGHDIGTVLATKHDAKYYVMRAGADTVYEARDYMFTRLDKQRADFVESETAATATTLPPPSQLGGEPPAEDEGEGDLPEDEGEE